jgi:hypothetical protein
MPRRLMDLIKRFDFVNETRARMDLAGGLRFPVGYAGDPPRLELPQTSNGFSTSQTLSAATWVTNPLNVKEWRGFEADVTHVADENGDPLTFARYRLSDGVTTYWWDGAAWTAITPLDSEWSTEEQVATNIGSFPLAARSIRVIINLYTTNAHYTPIMRGVRIWYASDIDQHEDYITRSLVPSLREAIRPISRILLRQVTTGVSLDFDPDDMETPYDVTDIDAVYDEDGDPDHLVDLFDSFAANVITLNTSVTADTRLLVRFVYRPQVAVRTSRDYTEVERVPAIQISEVDLVNAREMLSDDTVINRATGVGIKVKRGRMRDIAISMVFMTDTLVDYQRLAQELTRHFTANTLLRSRGLDEEFTILIEEDPQMQPAVSSKDIHTGQLRIRIVNAVFFERGSEEVFGVTRFNLVGTPRSGYHTTNVIIS